MQPSVLDEQCVAAEAGAVGEDHSLGVLGYLHIGKDLVGPAPHVDCRTFRHRGGVGVVDVAVAWRLGLGPRVTELFDRGAIIKGQNEIPVGLLEPGADQFLELLRMFGSEVLRLGPVGVDVVELPDVLVEVALTADGCMQRRYLPAVLP